MCCVTFESVYRVVVGSNPDVVSHNVRNVNERKNELNYEKNCCELKFVFLFFLSIAFPDLLKSKTVFIMQFLIDHIAGFSLLPGGSIESVLEIRDERTEITSARC